MDLTGQRTQLKSIKHYMEENHNFEWVNHLQIMANCWITRGYRFWRRLGSSPTTLVDWATKHTPGWLVNVRGLYKLVYILGIIQTHHGDTHLPVQWDGVFFHGSCHFSGSSGLWSHTASMFFRRVRRCWKQHGLTCFLFFLIGCPTFSDTNMFKAEGAVGTRKNGGSRGSMCFTLQ